MGKKIKILMTRKKEKNKGEKTFAPTKKYI